METIKNYLESMFMNLPKSVEISRAKEELMSMMEDKYNELKAEGKSENEAVGRVISEFGNLDELSEELGIKESVNTANNRVEKKKVSMDMAEKLISTYAICGNNIAIGVMICICSPILLIVLSGIKEAPLQDTIGITGLFIMVAVAVGLFVYNGMKLSKYEYLQKESFQLDFATDTYIRQLKDRSQSTFIIKIMTGVILCIVSVIPVVIVAEMYQSEVVESISVGIMLFVISIAVHMFVTAGMQQGSYKILLQEEEYSVNNKEGNKKLIEMIGAIYWPVIVCIYLGDRKSVV